MEAVSQAKQDAANQIVSSLKESIHESEDYGIPTTSSFIQEPLLSRSYVPEIAQEEPILFDDQEGMPENEDYMARDSGMAMFKRHDSKTMVPEKSNHFK